MAPDPIRIILVDDHPIVRKSIRTLLESSPRFDVIADFEDGDSALEHAERLIPDIMLVDINMSPMNGFTLTERVLQKIPSVKVIALSINIQPKYAIQMLEMGARGYLTKTSPPREITQSIINVHNGAIYICNEVKKNMPADEE